MAVLVVLFGSWFCFRAAGFCGVVLFNTWSTSARYALAVMFLFTGVAHFTNMKHEMTAMVPRIFPHPLFLVYITGVLEILGAVGLLLPRFQVPAACCLIVLLIAMFPANIKAARDHLRVAGRSATPLSLRIPMQALFIGLLWWSSARP